MTADSSARRRVIVVGPSPPPLHGVAVYTRMVLDGFRGRGLAAEHLDTGDRRPGGNLGSFDLANLRAGLRAALRLLLRHRCGPYTTLYLPLSQNRWAVLRDLTLCGVARLRGSEIVMHLHGSEFATFYQRSGAWLRTACRWGLRRARRVVVLGESLRPVFDGLVPAHRIVVIPNGVPDPAPPVPNHPVTALESAPYFLYLGGVASGKGVLDIVEAARLLRASGSAVRFLVCGSFPSPSVEALCRGTVEAAGVATDLEFVGPIDGAEKTRLLRSSRALVCPSRDPEGMPLVLLEAMALAVPVIATPKGAIPEVIRHGVNGLLVPAGSPPDLAAAILKLLQDPDEAARLGRCGRASFESLYTADRVLDDLQDVLFSATDPLPRETPHSP